MPLCCSHTEEEDTEGEEEAQIERSSSSGEIKHEKPGRDTSSRLSDPKEEVDKY